MWIKFPHVEKIRNSMRPVLLPLIPEISITILRLPPIPIPAKVGAELDEVRIEAGENILSAGRRGRRLPVPLHPLLMFITVYMILKPGNSACPTISHPTHLFINLHQFLPADPKDKFTIAR